MEKVREIYATKKHTKMTPNIVPESRDFWKNLTGNSVPYFHFLTDEKSRKSLTVTVRQLMPGQDFHNHSRDRPKSS